MQLIFLQGCDIAKHRVPAHLSYCTKNALCHHLSWPVSAVLAAGSRGGMCLIIDIVANHVRQMTVQPDWTPTAAKTYLGPAGIKPFDKDDASLHAAGRIAFS